LAERAGRHRHDPALSPADSVGNVWHTTVLMEGDDAGPEGGRDSCPVWRHMVDTHRRLPDGTQPGTVENGLLAQLLGRSQIEQSMGRSSLPGHTRSPVGCFLSYDYHIDWMYFVLYAIWPKLVCWLSVELYHRAILSPIYSTPIYPTLRRRVLSLHDGVKLRKGADQLKLQDSSDRRLTRLVLPSAASVSVPAPRSRLQSCADHGS
jgi:hypothetical protein